MRIRLLIILLIALSVLIFGGVFIFLFLSSGPSEIEHIEETENKLEERNPESIDGESLNEITLNKEEVKKFQSQIQAFSKQLEEIRAKTEEFIGEQQRINLAREKSSQIKGLYMTSNIASSRGSSAVVIRQEIENILDKEKLNGLVIDVKEAQGIVLPETLKKLIEEFHQKDVWLIARIVAFRDSSLIEDKPEWYLRKKSTSTEKLTEDLWMDSGEEYWLDPASEEVQDYIIEFSKEVIDFGFDELQFDYLRFPSDGDLQNIVYPTYQGDKEKYEIIQSFLMKISEELRLYNPSIILSVDFFGNVAVQYQAPDIGQRLEDIADLLDYVSFMLYPSHYYDGFEVGIDKKRGLPALYLPYDTQDSNLVVSNYPYEVVSRSVFSALDYLSLLDSRTKIRPWLQDFDLRADMDRGIYYDAEKVKAQIRAAEDSGAAGWLIWSSNNIYTEEAFKDD